LDSLKRKLNIENASTFFKNPNLLQILSYTTIDNSSRKNGYRFGCRKKPFDWHLLFGRTFLIPRETMCPRARDTLQKGKAVDKEKSVGDDGRRWKSERFHDVLKNEYSIKQDPEGTVYNEGSRRLFGMTGRAETGSQRWDRRE
jgi:hypothetical protein